MAVRTQPTISSGMSARIAEATGLSPFSFRKSEGDELGEEDNKEDESLDADDEREGQYLDDEGEDLDDESQQQAVLVIDTVMSEPLGLGYGAARSRALESIEEIAPSTYEPILVTWVDHEDDSVYPDILAYAPLAAPVQILPSPEWSRGSLPVSPSSFVRYRFRNLEREQERAMVTFSAILMPILALEAWAGQTDAQRAAMWHATYDIQRENHDLRRHLGEERRERLEPTYRVAKIEKRQESRGE
uniref:Uncharacterized protein n=1 Tax=Tanacetum cinerariifolium TaxID=118510 RepID=A0A6L2LAT6_TANCI|nr:hypothetical protein [Tanacetum cinerariifolium]